jgi:hypothetical protein
VTLSAQYPFLLLDAPVLDLPAQTLQITVSGLLPPYLSSIYVIAPDGTLMILTHTSLNSPFTFGSIEAGDAYFGVSQIGTWQAEAVVNGVVSNSVTWQTVWLPVHVTR